MNKIINGKEIATKILSDVKNKIQKESLKIRLDIIQIGNNESSNIYVRNKIKRGEEVGIEVVLHKFEEKVTEKKVKNLILELNTDKNVSGFFIQSPIPNHLNLSHLASIIDVKKDVDGMSPITLGQLLQGDKQAFVSATAAAVLEILKHCKIKLEGKHAVIIGRSLILGKPLMALLLNHNATVTVCHSKTKNLKDICKTADILISCTGVSNLVTKDFVKKGAIVIDCGSPIQEVDFENVKVVASFITPVPGGVGPLTISCILQNCIDTATHK